MRFKLDENLGSRTQDLFRAAGHDVQTVWDEKLQGHSDRTIYDVCCVECRCLVTLDLDFSDVTRFSPSQANGIVVIRVPKNPSLFLLKRLVSQFLQAAEQMPVDKGLWIVEIGRIRIHQIEANDDDE